MDVLRGEEPPTWSVSSDNVIQIFDVARQFVSSDMKIAEPVQRVFYTKGNASPS